MVTFRRRVSASVISGLICLVAVSGLCFPFLISEDRSAFGAAGAPEVIRDAKESESARVHPWQHQMVSFIPPESAQKNADKEPEPLLKSFMRRKLVASNRILEGLVTDNFEMVEQSADELMQMSVAATWRVSNDALYRRYSTEFHDAVGEMKEKARAKS
jgi:hypothetical protein